MSSMSSVIGLLVRSAKDDEHKPLPLDELVRISEEIADFLQKDEKVYEDVAIEQLLSDRELYNSWRKYHKQLLTEASLPNNIKDQTIELKRILTELIDEYLMSESLFSDEFSDSQRRAIALDYYHERSYAEALQKHYERYVFSALSQKCIESILEKSGEPVRGEWYETYTKSSIEVRDQLVAALSLDNDVERVGEMATYDLKRSVKDDLKKFIVFGKYYYEGR